MKNPEINLICSECQCEFKTILWANINAATDTEAKEKILKGILFEQICPNCNSSFYLGYPVIYFDEQKKIIIYYENVPTELTEAKIVIEKIKNIKKDNTYPYKDYKFYIVKTPKELRKKVMSI